MGKNHPSLYAFLAKLKKEQAGTETMLRQLELGQRIRKGQDLKRRKKKEKVFAIVLKYDEYIENNEVNKYLKAIGHYTKL